MDRRNGGDPLAPPRPPKLLPRVHRPRAAEPPMMSEPPKIIAQQTICTNNHSNSSSNSINNNNSNRLANTIASSRNSNNNNHSSSNNNTVHLTTPLLQLHHQQQQQQHPHTTTTSLNRNNSNLSSASSASSVSTTVSSVNSFTRRRPPPPPLVTAVTSSSSISSTPSSILPLIGASLNPNLLNNNLNINSIEPVPVSPVTLAAPRPESERLTNEYVDTPFRTAQQLQQASRNQHPAGQHIHGQTTTQHNLLLLQQSQRQQQQQNQQQQHHSSHHQSSGSHSNVIGSGACVDGSAVTAASIHSNSLSLKGGDAGTGTAPGFGSGATHATSTTPAASATLATSPATITRLQQHHRPNALPITQPITKQPASTATTFKKDLSASIFSEEPLDLHHIGSSGGSSTGGIGSSGTGSPIGGIILGDGAINPITCPRCERCRCEQCQSPRQLPQTWVCNKTCLCSAETIIDYASCLCCVKALFYHCARDQDMECDDDDSTLCVDDPCSCLPNKRTQRWGWLGALSLVLPCLWCYWPMRGCVAICEKCYARHAGHGCRCQAIGSTSSMLPIVNIGRSAPTGGANAAIGGTKSSGISGGVHSGISGSGHHQHHHHHHHHGGGNTNGSDLSAARILRKCDITPEKRLLDSSPEY